MNKERSLVVLAERVLQDSQNQTLRQTKIKHLQTKIKHCVKHRITQKWRNLSRMGSSGSNIAQTFLCSAKNGNFKIGQIAKIKNKIKKLLPKKTEEEEINYLYELFEERASIIEYDSAELNKKQAEEKAFKEIKEKIQEILKTFPDTKVASIKFTS